MSETPSSHTPDAHNTDPQTLAIEAAQLRAALEMQKQEGDRLRTLADQRAVELTDARQEQEATIDAWHQRLDQLKERAVRFRDAYDAQVSDLADKDKQVAVLTSKLESREAETERLANEREGLTDALDRERASLGNVLEARLIALEEFTRMTTDRIATQMEILTKIEERAVEHEALTQRLLGAVTTLGEPLALKGETSGDLPAVIEVLKRPRIALFTGGVLALPFVALLLIVWLVSSETRGVAVGATAGPAPRPTAAGDDVDQNSRSDSSPSSAETPHPTEKEVSPHDSAAAAAARKPEPEPAQEAENAATGEGVGVAAASVPRELTTAQEVTRKKIRKKLFAAYNAKAWQKTIGYGERLRDELRIDWEAEFRLAEALRKAGRTDDAAAAYQTFVENYPESGLLDEVLYRRASILAKTDQRDEAVKIFAYLSARKNPFRGAAKKALKGLRKRR